MTTGPCYALIPAAGMGRRMGASINKQYLELFGMPIVARTIQAFSRLDEITGIVLVIPEQEIAYCQEQVIDRYHLDKVVAIVPGGAERQQSVLNGLTYLTQIAPPEAVVLIHDGVRPFISSELIRKAYSQTSPGVGTLVAVPVKDTIKVVEQGVVTKTPDRRTLWQAQTPQSFTLGDIYDAHCAAQMAYAPLTTVLLLKPMASRFALSKGSTPTLS
jgi:2-C-methyl-D-erythritol 4-phosphate cytidylyltransferase